MGQAETRTPYDGRRGGEQGAGAGPCLGASFRGMLVRRIDSEGGSGREDGGGGAAADQETDRGVPGGVKLLQQIWRWDDHDQGAGHGDAVAGAEPNGGGAAGDGGRGGRGRQ